MGQVRPAMTRRTEYDAEFGRIAGRVHQPRRHMVDTSPFNAVQAFGVDPSHLADIALAPELGVGTLRWA